MANIYKVTFKETCTVRLKADDINQALAWARGNSIDSAMDINKYLEIEYDEDVEYYSDNGWDDIDISTPVVEEKIKTKEKKYVIAVDYFVDGGSQKMYLFTTQDQFKIYRFNETFDLPGCDLKVFNTEAEAKKYIKAHTLNNSICYENVRVECVEM